MKIFQVKFCIGLMVLLCIFGCSNVNKNINQMRQTTLIFGLSKPDGSEVTKNQWSLFLKDYVTPKFKEGFTIIDAYGQYLGNNGKIVKEKSKILIFLHKNTKQQQTSIDLIINNYKKLFQQECVLEMNSFPKVFFK